MATPIVDDLQVEAPPLKRVRVEEPVENTPTPLDDMDDIYSTTVNTPTVDIEDSKHTDPVTIVPIELLNAPSSTIPGLRLLGQSSEQAENFPAEALQSNASKAQAVDAQAAKDSVIIERVPEDAGSPSVITALEALLGGLDPPPNAENLPGEVESITQDETQDEDVEMSIDLSVVSNFIEGNRSSSDSLLEQTALVAQRTVLNERAVQDEMVDMNSENIGSNGAEFEIDSSPIQSSDDSDSDDSSSSEESDEDVLLNPEEQARILMQVDDDDDDFSKGDNAGAPLRTRNEVPENIVPKPNVTVTPDMRIEELGAAEAIVENILLIKAKTSGEYRVLESGSVLCLDDRSVIGVVSETLGRVQQPLYSVLFTNAQEIAQAGLSVGTKIYYSEQHSTFVFTQSIKAYKGSDASNLHDEEVGDEEVEFSDDEKEAEHKRRIKQRKEERKNKRPQNGGGHRGPHPLQQQQSAPDQSVGLIYEEDEGPYKPLSRPAGFANVIGRSEAPQESAGYGRDWGSSRDDKARSNGRGRGRNDRSRGKGERGRGSDRGRGRGGFQDRRSESYSQPVPEHGINSHAQAPQGISMGPSYGENGYDYNQAQGGYSPQQSHYLPSYTPSPYSPPAAYQQHAAYPPLPAAAGWPHLPPPPPLPVAGGGAYINPAFFGSPSHVPPGQQWYPPSVSQPTRNPEAERAFQEVQDRLNILRNLSTGHSNGQ